ncbi:MAG: S41 family peptidase [Acidobacteria bacterium]|nr:S41 family peptidase [Acidobacteriota bacterium]
MTVTRLTRTGLHFGAGALAALLVVLIGTCSPNQQSSAGTPNSETYRQLDLFGQVFQRVREDYVETVDDQTLIHAALNGMLQALDPHSSYMSADQFEEMQVQTSGRFGGLGIEVTMENGFVKVVSPIDDTPAYRAGVLSGDLITHIDEEAVLGLTLSEAVDRMRGEPNTEIIIRVSRPGVEPFDVSIIREIIHVQSVRARAEGNVGYIRISSFTEQTTNGVKTSFEELHAEIGPENIQGIVLDLRNNPGGLLTQAVAVTDFFLERGVIVSTRGRANHTQQQFNASSGDISDGLPIVVLVNGGSASASEIVSGALQDHGRAILMGTKTFGKGSVQTVLPLGDHGAMRLTTARYYTPEGRSIQSTGVTPDIEVPLARIEVLETGAGRSEATLRNALESESESQSEETDSVEDPANDPAAAVAEEADPSLEDYQLQRALDLLRGLELFRPKAA